MKSLGQIGYEAYAATADWKTFDGRPMPQWGDPAPAMTETRRRWQVAAEAVAAAVCEDTGIPHG